MALILLALDILKENPKDIHSNDDMAFDSCPICYESLLSTKRFQPFVVLMCDHIFHYECIDEDLKNNKDCPCCHKPFFGNGINSVLSSQEHHSPDVTHLQIPSSIQQDDEVNDPRYNERTSSEKVHAITTENQGITLERPSSIVNNISNKASDDINENNSSLSVISMVNNVEFTGSSSNLLSDEITNVIIARKESERVFTSLIQNVINAENRVDKENQETILCYFRFGEAIENRFNEIMKYGKFLTQTAMKELEKEICNQLPNPITKTRFYQMKEKASKIYFLFNCVGEDKIFNIRSHSTDSISRLTKEEIKKIIHVKELAKFYDQLRSFEVTFSG